MAQGVRTSDEKVAEFRAHYLVSGNISASSREVGIPIGTGYEVAQRLKREPDFREAQEKLREGYLNELVDMRQAMAQVAFGRFAGEDEGIESFAKGDNVTIIDKRPEYGKLIIDAEKNAHHLSKMSGDETEDKPSNVTINISAPDGSSVSVD